MTEKIHKQKSTPLMYVNLKGSDPKNFLESITSYIFPRLESCNLFFFPLTF